MKKSVYLKDEHWEIIKPYIKEPKPREDGGGRERRDPRAVLEGILWVLKTGARWRDLPRSQYPPYQTCHRRFQEWIKNGSIYDLLRGLARILKDEGIIKTGESYIDGSFASAKKGSQSRENQERQGYKDNGCRRQRRPSNWYEAGQCVSS